MKGWIDGLTNTYHKVLRDGTTVTTVYDAVGFCPTCHPIQNEIVATSVSQEEMGKRLRARGSHAKVVEKAEEQRARTL